MKATTKAIRFLEALTIPEDLKAGELIMWTRLTPYMMRYINTSISLVLMAQTYNPFQAMLMAERERNEPPAGGVLLFVPAYLDRI